jgi:small conductance mechanosensitive channel
MPAWITDPDPWVVGAVTMAVVVVASIGVRLALGGALGRVGSDAAVARQVGRLAGLAVFVGGAVYALDLAGVTVGPLLGALGVGGIALAFAAQDILQNLVAGILIQLRRPFRVGDQIGSLDYEGTVRDIDLRAVRLATFDGLDVVLPSASVLGNPIVNHTRTPCRRTTLVVGVAYETDLEQAVDLAQRAAAGTEGVRDDPFPPAAYVEEFGDSTINLAVLFWHGATVREMRDARSRVAIEIKRRFDEAGVEIAFPQREVRLLGSAGSAQSSDRAV